METHSKLHTYKPFEFYEFKEHKYMWLYEHVIDSHYYTVACNKYKVYNEHQNGAFFMYTDRDNFTHLVGIVAKENDDMYNELLRRAQLNLY